MRGTLLFPLPCWRLPVHFATCLNPFSLSTHKYTCSHTHTHKQTQKHTQTRTTKLVPTDPFRFALTGWQGWQLLGGRIGRQEVRIAPGQSRPTQPIPGPYTTQARCASLCHAPHTLRALSLYRPNHAHLAPPTPGRESRLSTFASRPRPRTRRTRSTRS